MLRALILLAALAFSPAVIAAEPALPSGPEWNKTSEAMRQMYATGFLEGFNGGIGSLQMEQAGRSVGEAVRDGKPVPAGISIKVYPYKEEDVLKRMNLIYGDPRNVNLLWNEVGELALRMLDGQDVEWRLQLQRQARDQRKR